MAPPLKEQVGGQDGIDMLDLITTVMHEDGRINRPLARKIRDAITAALASPASSVPDSALVQALRTAERLLEEYRPFDDIEACQTFPEDRTPEDEMLLHDRQQIRAALQQAESGDA
jgi:hypothetical protein